jgi:hypothetical protein
MGGQDDYSVSQSSNIIPPRLAKQMDATRAATAGVAQTVVGQVIAITVDATSRRYDLTQLLWQEMRQGNLGDADAFFVSFQTDSNNVFFLLDSDAAAATANAVSDTATLNPGDALVLPTASPFPGAVIIAGLPPVDVRLNRQVDKTLIVKCAAAKTSVLRFWPSSQRMPGAT